MSQHSDEGFSAASESFWEPGNFKKTTRRIDDGNKLCSDLMKLVSERAEMEKTYATGLKSWAAKWNSMIEKGPEYGTTEAAWKALLVEADRQCELHNRVKEDLNLRVNGQLKQWQKETYHKSMMSLKEKKEMDDQFKKAQKPWAKLLSKVNKAKADYHNACKAEKTAVNQERNAAGDSALSQDQMRKLQDRVAMTKDKVLKTRENYQLCLQDINNYNPKYMEDMTDVFERCQRMEAQRLQCFKDILFTVHKCLNISEDENLPQIYEEFYHTVNNADHEKDLRWWSNTHGVNMTMNWPQFEEYTEEFREIAGKGKTKAGSGQIADGNITLINQRHVGDDLPEYNTSKQNGGSGGHSNRTASTLPVTAAAASTHNGAISDRGKGNGNGNAYSNGGGPVTTTSNAAVSAAAAQAKANPFDEDEWSDDGGGAAAEPLVDTGEPGVKVRALYDYDAQEEDELDFKIGDVFEKLEDEDEQGWCKGRKDGKVGLYPANYIEVIQ